MGGIDLEKLYRATLSGMNLEKMKGFLSPGTKHTVRNNEVSVKRVLTVKDSSREFVVTYKQSLYTVSR